MSSKRYDRLVGLLLLGLLLSSFLSVSGSPAPVVADISLPSVQGASTLPPLDIKQNSSTPTQVAPFIENVATPTQATPTQATPTQPIPVSSPTALPAKTAAATVATGTPIPPQPLPDEPLTLIRLRSTQSGLKLVDQLTGLAPVKASRLIPVEYFPAADSQTEQLLALIPTADASLFSNLTGLEYTTLDQDADTARYFWLKIPTDAPPQGEIWLDSGWKVLDQAGGRIFFKADLPLYLGFGFRSKLYIHKAPPRINVSGLTQACPCPALAEATFAGMTLETPPASPVLSVIELKTRVGLITEARLRQVVDQIAKNEVRGKGILNTRYTGTAGSLYAAERLFTYFFALGLKVEYDSFLEGGLGTVASNVIADQAASDPAQVAKPVLLIGHYDTLGERNLKGISSNPRLPAYGANDNGVGLAGMMEVARLLSGYHFTQPIRYIAFGAEEQGMLGSQNYVHFTIKPAASTAVINIDSFGYNPGEEDWVILGFFNHGAGLKDSMVSYREKYQIALRLEIKRGEPFFRSDDFYFDQTQHEAVVLTDSYNLQSPNNHTANDTLENVNFRTSRKVIQLTLVTVAEQAGMPGQ